MTKQEIIEKTKKMFIARKPELANRDYRIRLSPLAKQMLVFEMLEVANKIELLMGI